MQKRSAVHWNMTFVKAIQFLFIVSVENEFVATKSERDVISPLSWSQ